MNRQVNAPITRNFYLLLITTLLGLITIKPVYASFEKAMEIYSLGQFDQAKKAFEALAAIGDRASLFNLGVMYYRGEATDTDQVKAYVLMKIANEGINNESFTKISNTVFSKLSDTEKAEIKSVYDKYNTIYSETHINNTIFPRLLDDEDCPPDILPIKRITPRYPKSEASRGRMGLVYGEMTISPEGYPREINITSSTGNAFTQATMKGIESSLFEPNPSGKPIYGYRQVVAFQMEKNEGDKYRTKPIITELEELREKSENGDVIAQFLYGKRISYYRHFSSYIKEVDFQHREANEWYTKSARAGLVNAQYEIGRNMLEGRGCAIDRENGLKWITAAAVGGFSPAQAYLAVAESNSIAEEHKSRARISWLRNAVQSDNYAAKVSLAWELVSTDIDTLQNADEALRLLENKPKTYKDDIRILETQAMALAHKQNFRNAIKLQKKAIKIAESRNWVIAKLYERLSAYKNNQIQIGSYY